MAENSSSIDAPENKVCDICGGEINPDMCKPATLFREQCQQNLCEDHQKERSRFPILQNHCSVPEHVHDTSPESSESPDRSSEDLKLSLNLDQIPDKLCELHLISECNSCKPEDREMCTYMYLHGLNQEATENADTGVDSICSEISTSSNLDIEEVEILAEHAVGELDTKSDRIKQTQALISENITEFEKLEASPEEDSEELMLPLNLDQIPEKYCDLHLISECNSCKPEDRELCTYLHDLNQEATENADTGDDSIDSEISTAINMDVIREEINEEREKEKRSVEMQKDQIIQEINELIKDLNDKGQKNIEEVETLAEHTDGEIDIESERIKQTQALLLGNIAELERIEKIGSPEEVFLAVLHAEREAAKYQDMLNESSTTLLRKFGFEINNRLNNITDIGRITVEKFEPEIHVCEYFVTKSKGKVYWFDVLSDGKLIVLHTKDGNSLLSLYNIDTTPNKEPLSQLSVFGASSAVVVNDHLVIVQRWKKLYLHMVNIDDSKLSDGDDINAEYLPMLIQKFTEESLVLAIHKEGERLCFQILGLDGQIQRDIPASTDIAAPRFMRVNRIRSVVYVLDPINGCYGFNLNGDQIFEFAITDCDNYQGLAVDQNNAVYIAATTNAGHVLTKLSPKGEVLKEKDVDHLYPFMCRRNKLYLTGCSDQKRWIFSYACV